MTDDPTSAVKTATTATTDKSPTLAAGFADKTPTDKTPTDFPAFPEATVDQCARLDELAAQMQDARPPAGEGAVGDFPSPLPALTCSLHRLDREEARQRMATALNEAAAGLPRGLKVERLLATVRPVFVPRWLLQGHIQGQWRAQGVDVSTWEEACPVCHGSGRTGLGEQQRECERCWGSGREKQNSKTRKPEAGQAQVSRRELIDNLAGGLTLPAPQSAGLTAIPFLVPAAARSKLVCLRPASIYIGSALDGFRNRLASQLQAEAQASLKRYSRIEEFLLQPETVHSQTRAAVWLYPAYLAWDETREGHALVLCDALEGQVQWLLQDSAGRAGTRADGSRDVLTNHWLLIVGGVLITLVVALLAWYAGTL